MAGVSYALADFVTGGPILDLPINEGAPWSTQLNRPDALSCTVNLNDPEALKLDIRSASEPKKTVLLARTDDDIIVAWGLVDTRFWDDDARTLELTAVGIRSSVFGNTIIAPVSARTAPLTVVDPLNPSLTIINPALDSSCVGFSLGTIGKQLVAQRQNWPGMPGPGVLILPADVVGVHTRNYLFSGLKSIDSALSDLTNVEGGPDFAFDAQRASDGLSLLYTMRHGSQATPRIGVHAGSWSLSDITGLKVTDDGSAMASASWATAGKSAGEALVARALNDPLVTMAGYPPLDVVDTSHGNVSEQATLNSYAVENLNYAARPERSLSFKVRGSATPGLGQFRPGDTITIDVPEDHPYLVGSFDVRITSVGGDETGLDLDIGCVILNGA